MSTFQVLLEIGDLQGTRFESLEAWVDTGAFYTQAPRSLLRRLGVVPSFRRTFLMANGRRVQRHVGEARVRLEDQSITTPIVFATEGSPVLLGAYTLEGFALIPDPVNRRLVPMEALPLLSLF